MMRQLGVVALSRHLSSSHRSSLSPPSSRSYRGDNYSDAGGQVFGQAGITPASLAQVAVIALTVGPAIGGLLALVVYAAANTFGLIDEARSWPTGGVMRDEDFSLS